MPANDIDVPSSIPPSPPHTKTSNTLNHLGSVRMRVGDGVISERLSDLRTVAERYRVAHGTYGGVCGDADFSGDFKQISTIQCAVHDDGVCSVQPEDYVSICNDADGGFAVSVPLITGGYACADNVSSSTIKAVSLLSETSCAKIAQFVSN